MQAPELARSSSQGKTGYIVALAGSAIAILSFLALPFVSIVFFGSISFTLLQLVQSAGSSTRSVPPQVSQIIASIWFLLVIAIIACIVALIFTIQASSRALAGAISLIVLGVIGTAIFLLMIIQVSSQFTSIAIGGWLCLLGMIATAVGGIVAIAGRPPAITANT